MQKIRKIPCNAEFSIKEPASAFRKALTEKLDWHRNKVVFLELIPCQRNW